MASEIILEAVREHKGEAKLIGKETQLVLNTDNGENKGFFPTICSLPE